MPANNPHARGTQPRKTVASRITALQLKKGMTIVEKGNVKTFEYEVKEVLHSCDISHTHVRLVTGPTWCYDASAPVDILV